MWVRHRPHHDHLKSHIAILQTITRSYTLPRSLLRAGLRDGHPRRCSKMLPASRERASRNRKLVDAQNERNRHIDEHTAQQPKDAQERQRVVADDAYGGSYPVPIVVSYERNHVSGQHISRHHIKCPLSNQMVNKAVTNTAPGNLALRCLFIFRRSSLAINSRRVDFSSMKPCFLSLYIIQPRNTNNTPQGDRDQPRHVV